MFLLVPAYPGCPGQTAVKWLLLLLLLLYTNKENYCLKDVNSLRVVVSHSFLKVCTCNNCKFEVLKYLKMSSGPLKTLKSAEKRISVLGML